MKRISLFLLSAICSSAVCFAQDNPARAAAEREAAEEGYRRLNSAVEALTTGQADLQRRISALADEVRSVRAQDNKIDTSKFVTREDFNRLAKAIEEIEQKRENDKKLIREEFEQLKKDISKEIAKMLNAPATPSSAKKGRNTPATDKSSEKSAEKSSDKPIKSQEAAAPTQEGVWYVIQSGNTLNAIVNAHNEEFKKKGKKTSIKLVQDANPGLKPTNLKVDQKIWIPLVSE
ncbi:MAG TPA: LysM peptidoglycan-binding domain-containing protein [Haliangiales bacterium]|nr:LysM peptidoglycan-binding domain-containing protein [Haliangiales bacterium]